MTFDEAVSTLESLKTRVHTDDLETTIRVGREHEAIDFAVEMLCMLENREKHFSEWAKKNEAHVCATCGRASSNRDFGTACPIEDHYALPLDGHCHLWEEVKPPEEDEA